MRLLKDVHSQHKLILSILLICPVICFSEDNESYPVINSNSVLSSEYLSSTYHRVDSIDIYNGFYHFIVESDIGQFDISSLALLKKRVNEIKTISRGIASYKLKDEEFSGELRSQLSLSSDSAVDLLTSPFSTASNLAGQLASNLSATLDGEDPYVANQYNKPSFSEPNDPTTATHKRNIAFQLGLDIYTTNSKAQLFLNAVANARASGRVSAGIGLTDDFSSRPKMNELDMKIKYLMKSKPLLELNDTIEESLTAIGIRTNII